MRLSLHDRLKLSWLIAITITPLQIYIGHLSAEQVADYQPTKLAAIYYAFRIMSGIGFFLAALMGLLGHHFRRH